MQWKWMVFAFDGNITSVIMEMFYIRWPGVNHCERNQFAVGHMICILETTTQSWQSFVLGDYLIQISITRHFPGSWNWREIVLETLHILEHLSDKISIKINSWDSNFSGLHQISIKFWNSLRLYNLTFENNSEF